MTHSRSNTITLSSVIMYAGIAIMVILFCAYVVFQARFIISGPQIKITDSLSVIQNERQITLIGTAENITRITLNGRNIVTDQAGHFSEQIVLENGYNIVSIEAHDRYGRIKVLEREFVYTPLSPLTL